MQLVPVVRRGLPTNPKSVHHTNEYELMFESRDDFKITGSKMRRETLVPVNAAGKPIGPWADVAGAKHLSVVSARTRRSAQTSAAG